MCEKCVEIDGKIARVKTLARRIIDEMTMQGIEDIIAEHEAEKRALHPEQNEG